VKIVLSWLRECCATDLGAEGLADLLTSKGAEVESIERPWAGLSGVVVARVLEVRDHPNSEKLCLARVSNGAGDQEVVVGVRNMRVGDLVPLAGPGASVPVLPEPLGRREIRGVVSNGMLCSPMELGIAPTHEGILIFPSGLEPGQDVKSALGLDDVVLDIEVTPNRPDFLSVIGIAREVAAATGVPFVHPDTSITEDAEPAGGVATVEVLDLDRCPRYLARIMRGVRHMPSPLAVQARLTAAGMRPISAVIDATNYAMLEIGQPLHPFDLSLLKGPGIVVRRADDGERLVTLDDVERSFTVDDLLICDKERPVAVAGVMGGELAEVSEQTSDVLLESATFERGGIQRTRRRIELSTEASQRFERGVDPEAVPRGADRAAGLMAAWCGARVLAGVLEAGSAPERRRIAMRPSRATLLLGYDVAPPDAAQVFDRLGMAHEEEHDRITVEVPGYRVDLEREVDLIEEVGRVHGYDRVPSTLPAVRQAGGVPPAYAFTGRIRSLLERAGLREVRLIPFVSEADLELTDDRDAIRVLNPLAADEGWLRTRLTPGLLRVLTRNAYRRVRNIAVFEVGTVFRLADGVPQERPKAAFAMTGEAESGWTGSTRGYDVFDAKGALEAFLAGLGITWSLGDPVGSPFHPGRSAFVMVGEERIGVLGEIHPKVAEAFDLPGRVAAVELEVEALMRHAPAVLQIRDVPRFPPVHRDLAFTLPAATPAGAVQASLVQAGGDLVGEVTVFDVFSGPPLPLSTKSLGFSVDFRAADRTLTDAEVDEACSRIAERIEREFGGSLRTA
jgi:phenylalanyl-tRNA synthetase beta chain